MIVGIDGGKPPKTVFAHKCGEGWVWQRTPPSPLRFEIAGAEKPEGVIRANRTPASVISPAGWGMAGLFSVDAEMRVWIPTEAWKRKLLGSSWNMKKEAACYNFVQMFDLKSLDPEDDKDQDVIDAVAIAEALARFERKELRRWLVRW